MPCTPGELEPVETIETARHEAVGVEPWIGAGKVGRDLADEPGVEQVLQLAFAHAAARGPSI
jgi:hypothetical protein